MIRAMVDALIRPATEADVPEILELYNARIADDTGLWTETLQTLEERTAWFARQRQRGDGAYMAELDGAVVGFASYGDFRNTDLWPGYRFSCENSVHVAETVHGRGIGRALMERLITHAADAGKHSMIAAVDGENEGSVTFHERLGFEVVGRLPELGWKFDRWLDLILLQRRLP